MKLNPPSVRRTLRAKAALLLVFGPLIIAWPQLFEGVGAHLDGPLSADLLRPSGMAMLAMGIFYWANGESLTFTKAHYLTTSLVGVVFTALVLTGRMQRPLYVASLIDPGFMLVVAYLHHRDRSQIHELMPAPG